MANNSVDEKTIFYDIIINYFMDNPSLYDKKEENYAYTIEKLEKLEILSKHLQELHIKKSVPGILHAWKDLIKQFKKQLANENKNESGSGSKDINFPYFEQLMFMKPALQHREVLSSINLSSNSSELNMPRTLNLQEIAYCSPSTSHSSGTSFSLATPTQKKKNVPSYDEFANKKQKIMIETDESINIIGKKIVETLDNVNNMVKVKSEEAENSEGSIDYKKHLTAALSKIPSGCEDECLNFVIQELESFDQQNM